MMLNVILFGYIKVTECYTNDKSDHGEFQRNLKLVICLFFNYLKKRSKLFKVKEKIRLSALGSKMSF